MDVKSLFSLEGKKGFITGSTRGIGKCLAEAFIELGADVAILGTNGENAKKVAAELSNGKSKVIGYECRVTDPASVNANIADAAAAAKLLLEMLFIAPPCQSMKIGKLTCPFYPFL